MRVTEVLRDAGLVDAQWFTDYARERGSALHLATALHDENDLAVESLDPAIEPRFKQYLRFLAEVRPEILSIEEPVESLTYQYHGTLDRRVKINGVEAVLDIKGPFLTAAVAIQLAGYALTFKPRPLVRYSLHLSDDSYKLVRHEDRRDFDVFKAALTVADFRRREGLCRT